MTKAPSPTVLETPFTDQLESSELREYRKGYRSFRAGTPRCPGELDYGPKTEQAAPTRQGGISGMKKVPSCVSMPVLGMDGSDDDEPFLASSPFRLRPCARDPRFCNVASGRKPGAERQPQQGAQHAPTLQETPETPEAMPAQPSAAAAAGRAGKAPMTLIFVCVWYFTGAFTNSSSKLALASLPRSLPLTLTLVQHLSATAFGTLAYRVLGVREFKPLPARRQLSADAWRALLVLCCVYTCGFALTNASFGAVNASFVDTVKAAEPITTVMLALLFLSNESASVPVLLSLLPIVGGVGISSMAEASASAIGLAFALGSNVCFSARSIAAKLVGARMGAEHMDGANLFVHVNRLGLLLLLPAVLAVEGSAIVQIGATLGREALVKAARLFAFNGTMYYLNNQMNFLVLEKVDTLTHGIINCGRRVANIVFAIACFGNKVNAYNGTGITLALTGSFLYIRAKKAEAKAKAKAAKKAKAKAA